MHTGRHTKTRASQANMVKRATADSALLPGQTSPLPAQSVADFGRWGENVEPFSNQPLYRNNCVELLIDGPATYRKMLDSIRDARELVYLETYIFADDEVGRTFASALKETKARGVTIAIIYDSVGSIASDGAFFDELERAGIRIIQYNSINPLKGMLSKLNNRGHRKLLIVDRHIAFTGGINLSETYSSSSSAGGRHDPLRNGWRDTQIAVTGPAVSGFLKTFVDRWCRITGESLPSPQPQKAGGAGSETVGIVTATGGQGRRSAIVGAYEAAIESARERVWITQAYFAPARGFVNKLKKAAKRGVDVRIIVPGITDSPLVRHASRSWYGKLLKKQIRIYESTHALLHAKTAVIDGIWSTVGTSNLDYRSFLHNDEINAVILGRRFGSRMEQQFRKDMENCRPVDLETWRRRPFMDKLVERLSRTVEYWL
jgi:cardiolipin synthase A/B